MKLSTVNDTAGAMGEGVTTDLEAPDSGVAAMSTRPSAPLSFAQRRLWFFEQLHPGSPVYTMTRAVRFRGALDVRALRWAMDRVVERHQVLRTRFIAVDGEPHAEVFEPSPMALPIVDIARPSDVDAEEELWRQMPAYSKQPFNIEGDLLVRGVLFRLTADHHVLLLNMHHIASDAASFDLFLEETGQFYRSIVLGKPPEVPELPNQYSDFAKAQVRDLDEEALQSHLDYWKQQLAGAPELMDLPADHPRPAEPTMKGGRIRRTLPAHLSKAMQQLGRREQGSLFMVGLAVFKVLLARLMGHGDIVVGMPISGRHQADTESLIGFFINTLVIRARLDGEISFREALHRVRETLLDAYSHQEMPFEKLVEALRPERVSSHAPLVQVMFMMDPPTAGAGLTMEGLEVSTLEVGTGSSKVDLLTSLNWDGPELIAQMEYNSDLFEAETIERWLDHYQVLLEGIIANPESPVERLPLISEAERRRLLVEWNKTATAYPENRSIPDLFREQALMRPHQVAVVFGERHLTYRELDARGNQLARALQAAGVRPGMRVGLLMDRSLEMIVAVVGILKAGAVYAALDPSSPPSRLAMMLEDLGPAALVVQSSLEGQGIRRETDKAGGSARIWLDSGFATIESEIDEDPEVPVTSEAMAYISFTSGSTGRPKGVCVPHRAVVRLVKETTYFPFSQSEVFLMFSSLSFDASTFEIWGALLNGGRVVVAPPHVPTFSELGALIQRHGVTTAWLTSGFFNQVVDESIEVLQPLRHLLTGGDVLSSPHVARAVARLKNCRIYNGYGPTENTTFTTCYPIPENFDGNSPVPIGRPISNTTCYVLDAHLEPVPIGVAGELYVGGEGLAAGYVNQPELTEASFVANPFQPGTRLYRTGDLVRYLPDGKLDFLGRRGLQVKVRGFRIELGEIESALMRHPGVRQCVVAALDGPAHTKQLVGYVVSDADPRPTAVELRRFLEEHLPEYMVPSVFVFLDSLPLSSNGKVDRRALPVPDARMEAKGEPVEARDDIERQLRDIWEDVLNVRPIGMRDSFFAMGGHSLLAVRLLARVEKRFGRSFKISSIFQQPTIEQFAGLLRGDRPATRASSIVEIQPLGDLPPLMLVHGAGGGMFWGYTNLARHLGKEQPVFAFKSRGLEGEEEFDSIEALADAYLEELLQFQPRGPYYLGGYCFGGLVAYEMARRLRRRGDVVAMVALINANVPNSSYTQFEWTPKSAVRFAWNLMMRMGYSACLHPENLGGFILWKARSFANRLRHAGRVKPSAIGPTQESADELIDLSQYTQDQRRVWEAHIKALRSYHALPYPGRVTLFRSPVHILYSSFDPCYGWNDVAQGGVRVKTIAGAHETIMEEPGVRRLAAAFRSTLAEARAENVTNPGMDTVQPQRVN